MRTTQQMSITLPVAMAELIRTKVQDGEYASESEVIRDGMRSLLARDRAVDAWLLEQVAPAFDELARDPESARTVGQVRARMIEERTKLA